MESNDFTKLLTTPFFIIIFVCNYTWISRTDSCVRPLIKFCSLCKVFWNSSAIRLFLSSELPNTYFWVTCFHCSKLISEVVAAAFCLHSPLLLRLSLPSSSFLIHTLSKPPLCVFSAVWLKLTPFPVQE